MSENLLFQAIDDSDLDMVLSMVEKGEIDPNAKNEDNESVLVALLKYSNIEEGTFELVGKIIIKLIKSGARTNSTKISKLLLSRSIPIPILSEIFSISKLVFQKKGLLSVIICLGPHAEYQIQSLKLIENKNYTPNPKEMGLAMADYFFQYQAGIGLYGRRYEIRDKFIPVCKYLITRGADINVKAKYGHTPLMRAAMDACPEVCEFMLKNGADPNLQSSKGYTALMFVSGEIYKECVWENHPELYEIAKMLIEYGADPGIKANNNRTALSYAKSAKNERVIELLELSRMNSL